jgi:hypothetical protein
MMKNSVQTILILFCIILFYSVNITCVCKDSVNAKVEMTLTLKLSPEIQTPYWIVKRIFYKKYPEMFLKNSPVQSRY